MCTVLYNSLEPPQRLAGQELVPRGLENTGEVLQPE